MAQLIIYIVVLLAGIGYFAWTIRGRLALLRRAKSVDRRGDTGRRIGGVLRHVFGQWRLLHGDFTAGLMHFFIFWGFVVVLLNTLRFLVDGFFPEGGFEFPLIGRYDWLGGIYLLARDVFELFVLLAVAYAAYRRLVIRPKRLTRSSEAVLILAFIAILMVTDWLLSGAAVALRHYPAHPLSPAEQLFGAAFAGLGTTSLAWLEGVSWWAHLVTLLAFLNLLPLGKHFHVLTSVFSVYLQNLEPQGELAKLDFEDEALEDYGLSRIEQLTWGNMLDAYSCTECGRCDHFCPAQQTDKALSPKQIIVGTRDELYAHQPALIRALAAARAGTEPGDDDAAAFERAPLVGKVHTDTVLWACTTCGACDTHCPLFIEHVAPIVEMRRHLVLEEEGRFPKELIATFKGLETQGNPWSIGAHLRLEWAEGLEVPTLSDNPEAEYIYFVGCLASLDARNKAAARALVQLLKHAGVNFAVLDAEVCCGDPARRCGHEYLAQALIEQNAEQFKEAKPRKVFTACPHCFNTLKHEYHQFGVEFTEVLHHSQLLSRLLNAGKLKPLAGSDGELPTRRVVLHDSCYLGRYNTLYYNPRDVLRAVHGTRLLEAGYHHDKGFCCGAGGGRMFMEETEGTRINHFRLAQLTATEPELVAVACPYCLTMLDDAVKETGAGELPVSDIAVVLRDAILGRP